MTSTPQFSPSEPIAEEYDAEIFSEHEPQCRVIDLNIVALILEEVAAACREIGQSGDSEALQNFDPFEFLRVPVTVAANLTRGQQAGLTLSGADVVRVCREITRAMGGTVDSESDPPWVLVNPPERSPGAVCDRR